MDNKTLVDKEQNLRAYDGVEDVKTFTSKDDVEKYRSERKRFASGAVAFLENRLKDKRPVSVLDIGSGSSAFLYALQDKGLLSHGMGIEISKTRHDFAEQWKKDGAYSSVDNVHNDVRNVSFDDETFDVCTVLDQTFTYFYPIDAGMPDQVLQMAFTVLSKGGWLILEMSNFLDARRLSNESKNYYHWVELPETNKFIYALYKIDCSSPDGVICTESRYLPRDKNEEYRKLEYSKIYTGAELETLVLKTGFKKPLIFGGYDEKVYTPEKSNRVVLACQK